MYVPRATSVSGMVINPDNCFPGGARAVGRVRAGYARAGRRRSALPRRVTRAPGAVHHPTPAGGDNSSTPVNYTDTVRYRSRVTSSVSSVKHPEHPPPLRTRHSPHAPPPNTATRTLTQRTPGLASSSTCTLTPTSPSNSPTAIQGVPPIGWVACSVTNLCASNCAAAWWYSR